MKILKYACIIALCAPAGSIMGMNALRQKQSAVNRAKSGGKKITLSKDEVERFVENNVWNPLLERVKKTTYSYEGHLLLNVMNELRAIKQLIKTGTLPVESLLFEADWLHTADNDIYNYSQETLEAIYNALVNEGQAYLKSVKEDSIKDQFNELVAPGTVKKQEEKQTSEPSEQERKTISEEAVMSNFLSWQADADDKQNLSNIERTMFVLEHAYEMIKRLEAKLKDALKKGFFEEFSKYSDLQKEYATRALEKMKSTFIDRECTPIMKAVYRQFGRYFSYIQNPSENSFDMDQEVEQIFADFNVSTLNGAQKKEMVTNLVKGIQNENGPYSYLRPARKTLLQQKIACQAQNSFGAREWANDIYDLCAIKPEAIQEKVRQELKQYAATDLETLDVKAKQASLIEYVHKIILHEPNEELKKMYAKACMRGLTDFSSSLPRPEGFHPNIRQYFNEIQSWIKK